MQAIASGQSQEQTSQEAISNLEATLKQMRQVLTNHRENLGYFDIIKSRILSIKSLEKLPMKPEEESQRCYEDFNTRMEDYATQCSPIIEQQADICRKEIRRLEDGIRDAEMELRGWKSTLSLVTSSLGHLLSTKEHIGSDIKLARGTLRAIFSIPLDVWAEIFKFVIYAEFDGYLQQNSNVPLRSTPHILSHICQFWRRVLRGDKSLWDIAAIHPCAPWSQNKYDIFSDSIHNAGNSLTFVTNLSQSLTWSYKQVQEYINDTYGRPYLANVQRLQNHLGKQAQVATRNQDLLLQQKSYKIYVDMTKDKQDIAQKLAGIPFKAAHTLIFSSRSPLQYGNILNSFSSFPHVDKLVILNKSPLRLPTGVSDILRNLTSLNLILGQFPETFQLGEYLLPNLQELHLRDGSGKSLPSLVANAQLSHLQILGINYPARNFFERVEMNVLKTLVLYPFVDLPGASPTSEGHATSTYSRFVHLKFRDWSKLIEETDSYGAAEAFTRLASKTSTLASVTFDQCYVDGEALIQLITCSKDKEAVEGLPKLEEITLTRTEGITRDQCDVLKKLVSKLNVYR